MSSKSIDLVFSQMVWVNLDARILRATGSIDNAGYSQPVD